MKGTLYSRAAGVDQICNEALGHPLTYTQAGRAPKTLWCQGNWRDKTEPLAGSQLVSQDIFITPTFADVAQPAATDTIKLPTRPGVTFKPREWTQTDEGGSWMIYLAVVRA